MKIVVCGSMSHYGKMVILKDSLEELGHEVVLPDPACKNHVRRIQCGDYVDTFRLKIKYDYIRKHHKNIDSGDCVLVVNYDKNGVENYIGGNTFLEIGFAYVLCKQIFLLNPIPNNEFFFHEIKAMKPIVLNGDLRLIKMK